MSSSDTPITASPGPLFNEGDIVIRSCDGQDFLMYKVDLSRASPVFKTFPALATGALLQVEAQDAPLPVVALLEPASVLTTLLSLCKPKRESNMHPELASVAHVLEAAGKYEMEWQVAMARERMRELAETEPIQVYALACRFRLRAETAFAARRCLRLPMDTILACETEEQDFVTAVQFRRLLDYRDRCQQAVEAYLLSDRIYEACRSFESYDACTMQYYHGHEFGRGWQEAYVNLLLRVFRDCVRVGAVRLEDIVSVQMDLPSEICAGCSAWGDRMEILRERIASEIAQTIPQIQVSDDWDTVDVDPVPGVGPQRQDEELVIPDAPLWSTDLYFAGNIVAITLATYLVWFCFQRVVELARALVAITLFVSWGWAFCHLLP